MPPGGETVGCHMIRVLDSAGSTLVEWGRQQQQHVVVAANCFWPSPIWWSENRIELLIGFSNIALKLLSVKVLLCECDDA